MKWTDYTKLQDYRILTLMKKQHGYFYQQQEDDYGEGEDDAEVQQECLHKFSTRDYIMEPSIFNTLKRYVRKVIYMERRLGNN